MEIRTASYFGVLGLFVFAGLADLPAPPRFDERAKELAKKLQPAMNPTQEKALDYTMPLGESNRKKADQDLLDASKRMIEVLNQMEASTKSNGPEAGDLLQRAYGFRDDVDRMLVAILQVNINEQYKQAHLLGLFVEGKFQTKIHKGRDTGLHVNWEHVVPYAVSPEFSKSMANARIVTPSERRASDLAKDLDQRTVETAKQFRLVAESLHRVANDPNIKRKEEFEKAEKERLEGFYYMNLTKSEHAKVWEEAIKKSPGAKEAEPVIRGKVQKTRTLVGWGKNSIRAVVENHSTHPVEVRLVFGMVGQVPDDLGGEYTQLAKHETKLKMLAGESQSFDLDGNTSEKNRYRGWVLNVYHGEEAIYSIASDQRLKTVFGKEVKTGSK